MDVQLAYGRQGLIVSLPASAEVLRSRYIPGVGSETRALHQAIANPVATQPLKDLVGPGKTVVVVHTDITRATPNHLILPVLLRELEGAGVYRHDITLLNGLGTHRPQTDEELRTLLGEDIVENYRCLQHDCNDDAALVALGRTIHGHSVRINRTYMEADVKILTGFIEPHFFAGFSGGPKAVLPSLAGRETVFTNHGQQMIASPHATWGRTRGNPIWEEMRDVALRTQPDFLLNVTLNRDQQITSVFAGDLLAAHEAGCRFVKEQSMVAVNQPFDVVVTSNSGYPLDQNLYQSVKGMSVAAEIVRPGGAIVLAAACEDGLPDYGLYADLLRRAGSPDAVLEMVAVPGFEAQDQWQVQIQAQIQKKAEVHVYADGLSEEQIANALLLHCHDITATVTELSRRLGPRVAVIPEGPQTIPFLATNGS